ncbi:hypothetical protein diail_7187 [Diaporthe ilicicola]|nr:hypothetical protein diail_7187 [Diaporthe ilicicola]
MSGQPNVHEFMDLPISDPPTDADLIHAQVPSMQVNPPAHTPQALAFWGIGPPWDTTNWTLGRLPLNVGTSLFDCISLGSFVLENCRASCGEHSLEFRGAMRLQVLLICLNGALDRCVAAKSEREMRLGAGELAWLDQVMDLGNALLARLQLILRACEPVIGAGPNPPS